jgi:hypothetical protein
VSARAWLLVSWILVGAAVLVVHVVLLYQVVRAREYRWTTRIWAIVPPLAPVVAWLEGRRAVPILWVVLVVLYVILRMFG